MIYKVIKLREANENGFVPTLTTYILDEPLRPENPRKRPAVLICPGGGYSFCWSGEGEPIAIRFNAAGYHAFVLDYSVAPCVFPTALEDVSNSLKLIRKNAEEWNIDPDKIAVCGFSAGGHLTASIGTLWNTEEAIKCDDKSNKPNALILSYPVISSGEKAHRGSFNRLLGDKKDDKEMLEYLSLENRVSKDTPPTFIWHTMEDNAVPVENSLMFANALKKNNVPFEMHIFTNGMHGLSTVDKETVSREHLDPHTAKWMNLACEWLDDIFVTDANMIVN